MNFQLQTEKMASKKFEVVCERKRELYTLSPPSLRMTLVYGFISSFLSPGCYQLKGMAS